MRKIIAIVVLFFSFISIGYGAEITWNNARGKFPLLKGFDNNPLKMDLRLHNTNNDINIITLSDNAEILDLNTTLGNALVQNYVPLNNNRHLVFMRDSTAWVYNQNTNSFTLQGISFSLNIATGVDNNGDFIIYGDNNGCYNVTLDSPSCDFSNINIVGSEFVNVPLYTSNSTTYGLQWYQGVFYWLGTLGDLNYNYYDTSNNISRSEEVILNFSYFPDHYYLNPYHFDISNNIISLTISESQGDTHNVAYDIDDDILDITLLYDDEYIVGKNADGYITIDSFSLPVTNSVVDQKQAYITLYEDTGGTTRVGYYKSANNWVYDTDSTSTIAVDITSPNDNSSGGAGGGSSSGGGSTGDGTISVGDSSVDIGGIFDLDLDGDGEVGYFEAIRGIGQIPGKIIAQAGEYIVVISDFVKSITDREEPVYKPIVNFLIPSTNAGFFTEIFSKVGEENKGTIVGTYGNMIRYGLYFFLIVVLLGLYIYQRNNNG